MKKLLFCLIALPIICNAQPDIPTMVTVKELGISQLIVYRINTPDTTKPGKFEKTTNFVFQFDSLGQTICINRGYYTEYFQYNDTGKIMSMVKTSSETGDTLETWSARSLTQGWYYEKKNELRQVAAEIRTNHKHRLLRSRYNSLNIDVYDSVVHIYNPIIFLDSQIYYKDGKRTHQFFEQWTVDDGKPVAFRKGMDQFVKKKISRKVFRCYPFC